MIDTMTIFAQYGIAGLAIYCLYKLFINQQKNIVRSINEGFDKMINKLDEIKEFILITSKDPKEVEKND